jgi:hypothetical protein
MSDPRIHYIARRLEIALEGINYYPSVSTLFEDFRVLQEVSEIFKATGAQCVAFYCQV